MKVVVTGSNGLLGQKLVHLLKEQDQIQLYALSKGENRISDTSNYTYFSIDLTDFEALDKLLHAIQPDVVVNTAAMTNVDACEDDKPGCWKLNVELVEQLVNLSKKLDYKLIHLSTDFIFDGANGPYKEEDEPNPLSYYGKSKLAAEQIIQKSNINYAILRTIIVYGFSEKMSRSNIVLWAIDQLKSGQPLTIVDDQFRMPTLAEDLAKAVWLTIEKDAKGIFHVSGKDFMSVYEMVVRIAKHIKADEKLVQPIATITLNQKAKRPPKTGFILDKSIKTLNYQPHSFEEGLDMVLKQIGNK
ncbi:MAG: dTDP-4-dehydrorhamnose reductase [Vicingaceae bacterium]